MNEWMVILGIACHAFSGVPGLFLKRATDGGQKIAAALGIIGSGLGIVGALLPSATTVLPAWVAMDGLSVIFLLPIFLVPALGAIYGLDYWRQADHRANGQKLRFFYGWMTAGLAGVAISANSILFLVAWEIMALSAFFLITTEDEDAAVQKTGWIYLISTHTATLCLFALFAVMRSITGSFALDVLPDSVLTTGAATTIFLLALVGFGMKAGLIPLHIWLPDAHAMAPSHVSALMSGVLIKIGIYGMVRISSLVPHAPLWWGGTVLALGVISGVLGVVFALGQHDLKRLLAYHSVENIGIIAMGLGLALVGRSLGRADCIVLGLAGALLHVWNHGLFKSLLFLSAGAVIHVTHTREIDRLGGLARHMPVTALCFATGAVAICGLPPLNGFVSELLIYLGLFRTLVIDHQAAWAAAAFAAPALALIGALAVACFVKVFGAVFLGHARSEYAQHGREVEWNMTAPMLGLVACCLVIGLAPPLAVPLLQRGIVAWAPGLTDSAPSLAALAPLGWITAMGVGLIGLCVIASLILAERLRRHAWTAHGTWDCGYAAPSPTMQYTASSFAQMLVWLFGWVLRPQVHLPVKQSLFAGSTNFHSHVPDIVLDGMLRPTFRLGARITASFRFFQQGSIHAYLFYIVLTLIVLLLWR